MTTPADDPGARDEVERAAAHSRDILQQRGILLTGNEMPGELADLQSAVERFEKVVRDLGGDSFTDSPLSSDPDDPELVIPERREGEEVTAYVRRIDDAAHRLRNRGA